MKNKLLQFSVACFLVCMPIHVMAASQVNTPGTAENDNSSGAHAWNGLTNALTQNDVGTSAFENNSSQILTLTNYGFSIPDGATINGVTVVVRRLWVDDPDSTTTENIIQLIKDDVRTGDNKATANTWPASFTDATYGGSADLWGTTWSASDINNENFGVAIQVNAVVGDPDLFDTRQIDVATITVDYTAAASSSSGGAAARATRARIRSAARIMALRKEAENIEEFMSGTGSKFFFDTQPPTLKDVGIFTIDNVPKRFEPIPSPQERRQQLLEQKDRMVSYRSKEISEVPARFRAAAPIQTILQKRTCTRVARRNFLLETLQRINQRLQKRFGFICISTTS